jgi:hypothetical protein
MPVVAHRPSLHNRRSSATCSLRAPRWAKSLPSASNSTWLSPTPRRDRPLVRRSPWATCFGHQRSLSLRLRAAGAPHAETLAVGPRIRAFRRSPHRDDVVAPVDGGHADPWRSRPGQPRCGNLVGTLDVYPGHRAQVARRPAWPTKTSRVPWRRGIRTPRQRLTQRWGATNTPAASAGCLLPTIAMPQRFQYHR